MVSRGHFLPMFPPKSNFFLKEYDNVLKSCHSHPLTHDEDGPTNWFFINKVPLATVGMKLLLCLWLVPLSPGGMVSLPPRIKTTAKKPPTSAAFNLEGVNHVRRTDVPPFTNPQSPTRAHSFLLSAADGRGFCLFFFWPASKAEIATGDRGSPRGFQRDR